MSTPHWAPIEHWNDMIVAIKEGRVKDVVALSEKCDPTAHNNRALFIAVHQGNPLIVAVLLAVCPNPDWKLLLFDAAAQNHAQVVRLLLGRVEFSDDELRSVLCAAIHHECTDSVWEICASSSQQVLMWGLVWCADTHSFDHPLFTPLFSHVFSVGDALEVWKGQHFTPARQHSIHQCVTDAHAYYTKQRLLPHVSGGHENHPKRL